MGSKNSKPNEWDNKDYAKYKKDKKKREKKNGSNAAPAPIPPNPSPIPQPTPIRPEKLHESPPMKKTSRINRHSPPDSGIATPTPTTTESGGYGRSGTLHINYEVLEKQTQRENFRILREEFLNKPNLFLIKNLMLSVQFFKNFDR